MTVESKATRTSLRTIVFACFTLASLSLIRATGQTGHVQKHAWEAGVNGPASPHSATSKTQTQSNAAEGLLGSDLPPVAIQPLAQQVRRLESALDFLGQPFSQSTQDAINKAISDPDAQAAANSLQQI